MNYYNEIDDYAADWIENLIAAGHIPAGIVDRRSIEDVTPADLASFDQCHFFAGIAGWPLALRIAGVPDDYPIWTGSCPCQPFSTAGAQAGFADERHLWPAFHWLIAQRSPAIVVGEQVASKVADAWIDLVRADMEALGAAFGAVAFPSASVGAPHIRDRTYWIAYADGIGREQTGCHAESHRTQRTAGTGNRAGYGSADDQQSRLDTIALRLDNAYCKSATHEVSAGRQFDGASSVTGGLADSYLRGRMGREGRCQADGQEHGFVAKLCSSSRPGPTNGFWSAADWLACRDDKWRPVEPGTFPLADGVPSRVGRLRAYGNAINPWQAAEFLMAALP